MTYLKQIGGAAALGVAMVIGSGLSAPPAQAAYIVTLTQEGSNVVASGSGTIDTAGVMLLDSSSIIPAIVPNNGAIFTGPVSPAPSDIYSVVTGPTNFGSGDSTSASRGSGDEVGIVGVLADLIVPAGYVSGDPLRDISTYDNQSFSSLGVTPGVYVYTFGSGANADSFTVDIAAAPVPEPASALLLGLPLGLVMLLATQPRRAMRDACVGREIVPPLSS